MSSVQLTTSSEERMNMYENMVEDLVNSDESSRYMLDGKTSWHSIKSRFRPTRFQFLPLDRRFVLVSQFIALNLLLMMIKHDSSLSSWEIFIDTRWSKNNKKKLSATTNFGFYFRLNLKMFVSLRFANVETNVITRLCVDLNRLSWKQIGMSRETLINSHMVDD